MLFRQIHLQGIRDGRITLAFRKWLRPTVKTGSRLRTDVGVLEIDAVEEIALKDITDADAKRSGFPSGCPEIILNILPFINPGF